MLCGSECLDLAFVPAKQFPAALWRGVRSTEMPLNRELGLHCFSRKNRACDTLKMGVSLKLGAFSFDFGAYRFSELWRRREGKFHRKW